MDGSQTFTLITGGFYALNQYIQEALFNYDLKFLDLFLEIEVSYLLSSILIYVTIDK